ncbi:MAG: hypothetical protein P8016_01030 [Sedimentisphaerales bacterium]
MNQIHPSAVIHKEAQLSDGISIGPNCLIEKGVSIGAGTILEANVVIDRDVTVGERNHFYANCVIGSRPQLLHLDQNTVTGGLVINFFMVGVHIGHDCIVEDKTVLSNYVQIGGHCWIQTGAWMSGLAASHQFVTIGKWCYVAGLAGINKDITPFVIVSGHYPQKVRGVNVRGLTRAGLCKEDKEKICHAFRRLYREGNVLLENAKALANEDGLDENVKAMIDAITRSSQHRFGRYRELSRKH